MSAMAQLKKILSQNGHIHTYEDIADIIRGVLAAPKQHDATAWMKMIAQEPSDEMREALLSLKADLEEKHVDTLMPEHDRHVRLGALRREMGIFEVDGFIVPRSDEHQGEYVSACAERLAWISGFTGSAGYAIVLQKKAAIFVDGRYTIQVRNEVSGKDFEYRHVTESPADDWLKDNLQEGMTLAYDPWLHTKPGLMRLKAACKKVGAKLVAAPHNFIDAVWQNRPAAPLAPVYPYPVKYAGQSHEDKLDEIAGKLKDSAQDAMVLSLPDSLAWLFNIRGADIPCTPVALGFAIVYADGTSDLFMDERKVLSETVDQFGDRVRLKDYDAFGKTLSQLSQDEKSVRVEAATIPVWVLDKLKSSAEMGADLTALPRAGKNETEIAHMRESHRRDGAMMVRFLKWLSEQPYGPELNEKSVAEKLDHMRAQDDLFYDYSFSTISGAGANGAMCHYRYSDESSIELPENGVYLVDSGGQYLDGTTDITRTVIRGNVDSEIKERFTRVLKGHIALDCQRFPKGTSGSQLDVLARAPLWDIGLDYDHGTGHGVGCFLNVHEGPQRIAKMPNQVALEVGMVVSNEPGYYKDGGYGIRLENLVTVQPSKVQGPSEREMLELDSLTLCPFDLNGIDVDLLDDGERQWLNDYHVRVREELSPLLDEDHVAWLKEATRAV